jgi:SAM-dependent methyltransferase
MELEYSSQYYERLSEGSSRSAAAVVPIIVEYISPKSVIDLGCGTGAWLAEFKRHGVRDILGVDGPHVDPAGLVIHPEQFLAADLTLPLALHAQFDLAMSLEVAEHLSADKADQLVDSLTGLSSVVMFSAAIPDQGGQHHINEQWPSYWIERFKLRGYEPFDPLRRFVWDRCDVEWWYAQNLILFIRKDELWRFPNLTNWVESGFAAYVHPRNYVRQTWQNRVLRLAVDLAAFTQKGDVIVLADEDQFGQLYLPQRVVRPFVEHNGAYFGPPRDDAHALGELIRMKNEGAGYLAFGWPAFWWLGFYSDFSQHLQQHSEELVRNDQLVLYKLKS